MCTWYYVVGETVFFYREYSIIFESCLIIEYNTCYILKRGTYQDMQC